MALEHGIPEQQFSTDDEPAEGISAAKALAIANAQGQRIYTIDRSNRDEALAALRLSSNTVSEIRQAVNAGRVVTTHTDPVTVPGWQGGGYVVLDPETGSGAWLIEGGLNGGILNKSSIFKEMFWSIIESISELGKVIKGFKTFIENIKFMINVFDACPSDIIFVALSSIAFMLKGFTFGAIGIIAGAFLITKVLYFSLVALVIGLVAKGFVKSCR